MIETILNAGFVFWGLWVAFAVILAGYILWMRSVER